MGHRSRTDRPPDPRGSRHSSSMAGTGAGCGGERPNSLVGKDMFPEGLTNKTSLTRWGRRWKLVAGAKDEQFNLDWVEAWETNAPAIVLEARNGSAQACATRQYQPKHEHGDRVQSTFRCRQHPGRDRIGVCGSDARDHQSQMALSDIKAGMSRLSDALRRAMPHPPALLRLCAAICRPGTAVRTPCPSV